MPVIKRQQPPLPPGEYVGIAHRVSVEWSKPRPKPDGSKSEPVQVFKIPLYIPGGQMITATLRVMDSTAWTFEQLCKSGELIPPDEGEFVLTTDDLEDRKFYFGVSHDTYNGAVIPNVRFHAPSYAIQVNPALESVSFPNEAPRGITLRGANPSTPPPTEPPSEASETAQAFKQPTPTQPPVATAEPSSQQELETLSDEECREALEYAKKLRAKKE